MNTLLCIGFGYCAQALAGRLAGWRIIGTSRSADGAAAIAAKRFDAAVFDGAATNALLGAAIDQATHILISAAPELAGDPVLMSFGAAIAAAKNLSWLGYLSTIGVYGDTGGEWVDEDTPPRPSHERAIRRLEAEQAWLGFGARADIPVQIFRIAGIYGPGRNVLADLKAGAARRLVKPGQVFNRIHVADIAQALDAAIQRGNAGRVYNLTDDEPASSEDVLLYAARLLGAAPPAPVPIEAAALSPMAASFYADNRRVRNQRIKQELSVALQFPTYREGLAALAKLEASA